MQEISYNTIEIEKVLSVLREGGLVVAPSDTVYGLLVDATNEEAVIRLTQFKNRPIGKPISVFVADFTMLHDQVIVKPEQEKMISNLLPGPFTIVLPSHHRVQRKLESERGSLGVRIPQYQFITDLTKRFGKPITATSANLSGRPSHYSLQSLLNELPQSKKDLITLAIDAGKLSRNKPSTIVDLTQAEIRVLRHGDLNIKDEQTYISESASQTEKVAEYILLRAMAKIKEKPVVILLQGDLGAGKTVFAKGLGRSLGIEDITSPTYVIYYEYEVESSDVHKFIHFDLYNIEEASEFDYLGIPDMLKSHNLICFEWGDKAGEILSLIKGRAEIISIEIKYISEKKRELKVSYS